MSSVSDADIRDAIREILKGADLSALSSKLVRKQLEDKFRTDLSTRKQEIDDILMSLINSIGEEDVGIKQEPKIKEEAHSDNESDDEGKRNSNFMQNAVATSSVSKNGAFALELTKIKRSPSSASSTDSHLLDSNSGKAKSSMKKRRVSKVEVGGAEPSTSDDDVDDEAYARKLQQQELRMRPRSSKQKNEKKPKAAKSASSEVSSRRKGNSLYSQECVLSPELAAVMGTDRLARKDVVSRMWKIFKERELMHPTKKQYVICDDQLEKVFKCKTFKAFSMMKILKTHIKDAKDVL